MAIFQTTVYESRPVEGVNVFLWQLTESLEALCAMLPDASILAAAPYVTFKSDKRKREWVAVRVLLRQVCGQPVSIFYKDNGKPYLKPSIAEFSVSHTKSVVGIALSQRRVGIDVEQIGPRPLLLKSQFVHCEEFDPMSVGFAELMATFMWSAKESVYKLLGIPGVELKADIHLFPIVVGEDYTCFSAKIAHYSQSVSVACYKYTEFVLTVATFD